MKDVVEYNQKVLSDKKCSDSYKNVDLKNNVLLEGNLNKMKQNKTWAMGMSHIVKMKDWLMEDLSRNKTSR